MTVISLSACASNDLMKFVLLCFPQDSKGPAVRKPLNPTLGCCTPLTHFKGEKKKLPTHPRQFANVCSTRVLFTFIIHKNHLRGGGGMIYFSLCYGLHRVVLRKGSEGRARWQSGLSQGKADGYPGGMPWPLPAPEESQATAAKNCFLFAAL